MQRESMPKAIIITGAPRSGTTLVCSLLNRLPDAVALNETMDVAALSSMSGNAVRVAAVAQYLADVRQAIVERAEKPERRLRGEGDNMFLPAAGGERRWAGAQMAFVPVGKPLRPDFTLALKHPNAFAALLPELSQRFDCCAVVRNPLAVLASWHSLDHPIRQGHAPMAEALDQPLAQQLAAVEDGGTRRLALLDWYFRRFLEVLEPERILRYEDIIASNGAGLAGLAPQARQLPKLLDAPLENRNDNALYGTAEDALLDAEALLSTPNHACWRLYDHANVATLRDALHSKNASPVAPTLHEPSIHVEASVPQDPPALHQPPNSAQLDPSPKPPASGAYQPKLGFMIVGAQKSGTTALAEYLREHPQISMPLEEGHVFDAPDFSPDWSPQEIDERYAPRFEHCRQGAMLGEGTPMYMFLPEVAAALQRYNPNLKLIVLLRERVERAISQYYMNKSLGKEKAPLWLALLAEPLRLRRCSNPRQWGSALRVCSYRRRGLYSRQLSNLHRHFPSTQIQVIRSRDLLTNHQVVLQRLFAFLGVAEDIKMQHRIASPSEGYAKGRHRFISWLLGLSYLCERDRTKALRTA